jgi:flagellar protein FliS
MANPYANYKTAASNTLTPLELLLALYDKCILECRKAVEFIEAGKFVRAGTSLKRAEAIVDELRYALDMKYEVSKSLRELYFYYRQTLITANFKKDASMIRAVIPHFEELKDAFSQIQPGTT